MKSSPKIPDGPAKPARLAIFIIAVVMGTIAALSAVIMAQLFDATVRGARDIQDILGVAPLTAVPVIKRSGGKGRRSAAPAYAASAAMAVAAILCAVVVRFIA